MWSGERRLFELLQILLSLTLVICLIRLSQENCLKCIFENLVVFTFNIFLGKFFLFITSEITSFLELNTLVYKILYTSNQFFYCLNIYVFSIKQKQLYRISKHTFEYECILIYFVSLIILDSISNVLIKLSRHG